MSSGSTRNRSVEATAASACLISASNPGGSSPKSAAGNCSTASTWSVHAARGGKCGGGDGGDGERTTTGYGGSGGDGTRGGRGGGALGGRLFAACPPSPSARVEDAPLCACVRLESWTQSASELGRVGFTHYGPLQTWKLSSGQKRLWQLGVSCSKANAFLSAGCSLMCSQTGQGGCMSCRAPQDLSPQDFPKNHADDANGSS
jgi:hypothetical protein